MCATSTPTTTKPSRRRSQEARCANWGCTNLARQDDYFCSNVCGHEYASTLMVEAGRRWCVTCQEWVEICVANGFEMAMHQEHEMRDTPKVFG